MASFRDYVNETAVGYNLSPTQDVIPNINPVQSPETETTPVDIDVQAPVGPPLRSTLQLAENIDVSRIQRTREIASTLNIPDLLTVAAQKQAEREYQARTLEMYPGLSEFAAQGPLNAAYARDNIGPLTVMLDKMEQIKADERGTLDAKYNPLERAMLYLGRGTTNVGASLGGAALAAVETQMERIKAGGGTGSGNQLYQSEIEAGTGSEEYKALESQAQGLTNLLRDVQGADVELPQAGNTVGQFAYDSLEVFPQLFGSYIANRVGGIGGATAFMSGQVAGGQYLNLRDQGVDPDRALAASVANAALAAPLEALQLGSLFRVLRGRGIASVAGRTAEAIGTGLVTESAQSVPETITTNWALGREITGADIAAGLQQGFYEGALMAPYALLGGGVTMVRSRINERRSQAWADNQQKVYDNVQSMLPEKGGDSQSLEAVLLATDPAMRQEVFLPAGALEEAGRRVVGIDEALGLDVNNTDMDRVSVVPLARIHARLTPDQFAEVLPIMRRSMEATNVVESRVLANRAVEEVGASADVEAVNMEEMDMAEATAQFHDDIRAAAANIEEATELGQARLSPVAVSTFLQSAAPEDRAQLLEGLGITEEQVSTQDDFFVDLDMAIPRINQNPLFDGFVDLIQLESAEAAAERRAVLETFSPPANIVAQSGADVSRRTRRKIQEGLIKAGRTAAGARLETEIAARMASSIARFTGQDANKLARNTFRFGLGTASGLLNQSAFSASPNRFNRPSLDYIGSGEGAQVHGWGLYALRGDDSSTMWTANTRYRERLGAGNDEGQTQKWNIPDDDVLLDEAENLSDQPEKVLSGLKRAADSRPDRLPEKMMAKAVKNGLKVGMTGRELYRKLSASYRNAVEIDMTPIQRAGSALNEANNMAADRAASLFLKSHGIQGIAYIGEVDGPAAVIFDDQAIEVLETYYQGQQQDNRGSIEMLSDGTMNIVFRRSQDASTAVHEFAHAFRMRVEQALVTPQDQIVNQAAFDEFKTGWADVEAWLSRFDDEANLVAEYDKYQKDQQFGGREFSALSAEEKAVAKNTAQHEYFARGFEAYLMEGKAPSSGLKSIFAKMKEWLKEIYKAAVALDVEINDDVRRFFDSMLASDEEIVTEALRTDLSFTSEEEAELRAVDPEAVDRAVEAATRAREEAEKIITTARVKERNRLLKQWRREGKTEADNDPRWTQIDDIIRRGGISAASMADDYDGLTVNGMNTVKRGLVSTKGSLAYDVLADELGYENGDALVNAILATPSKQSISDDYVAAQEADFAEYFSLDAGISDAEIRAKEEEIKLWSKYMGEEYREGSLENLIARVRAQVKDVSIDELLRLSQKDIKAQLRELQKTIKTFPKREAAAVQRGARAGYKFGVADADLAGRIEAMKERQELLVRFQEQARRAREIAKFEALAKRIARQKVAEKATARGIRPDFHSQIKNLLSDAGIGSKVRTDEGLADFIQRMAADGVPIDVAPEIVNGTIWEKEGSNGEMRRRRLRSLTVAEFQDVKDAVDNLLFLGRRQQQIRYEGVLRSEDAVVDDVVKSIETNNNLKPVKTGEEIYFDRNKTGVAGLTAKGRSFFDGLGIMSSTRKLQALAFDLDGQKLNGPVQQALYRLIDEGENTIITLQNQWTNGVRDIIRHTVGEKAAKGWAGQKFVIPEFPGGMVSKADIVMAMLNYGNEQNRTALGNHPVFGKDLAVLFRYMTEADWNYVQAIWDFLDYTVFPELNALTKKTKYVPLEKVDASPFVVTLPNGTQKTMRGGYFPLVFDRALSTAVTLDSKIGPADAAQMPTLFSPSEVQSVHTIKRVGKTYKDLVPNLTMSVLMNSLNDNIQDLGYREAVNDTWRVMKRPEVKLAVERVYGPQANVLMKQWLRDVVRGGQSSVPTGRLERTIRFLRSNSSTAMMALKASILFMQVTGVSQSAQLLGWGDTLAGVKAVYGHTSVAEIKRGIDAMYAKSPQLKHRNDQPVDRDFFESVAKGKDPVLVSAYQKYQTALWKYIALSDQMVANSVWAGQYNKSLKEGKNDTQAARDADAILDMTQGVGRVKNMSHAQHGWGWGEIGKSLVMFQTFFSSTANLFWLSRRKAGRQFRDGKYLGATGTLFRGAWNLALIPSVFSALMWGGLPDFEDDEEMDSFMNRFVRDAIANYTGGLPLIRDFVGMFADQIFGTGMPRFAPAPIQGSVEGLRRVGTSIGRIAEGEDPLRNTATFLRAAGPFIPGGFPSSQVATTVEGIGNWDDNEGFDKIYRLLIRDPEGNK